MANCRQCEKELPKIWGTDICLDCSRENLRKTFEENPELKQTFKESVEEMRKPEKYKEMADDIDKFMSAIQSIQNRK